MTCGPFWSNSVLDPHHRRDPTAISDHDLESARARIRELFVAAIEAVEPSRAVRKSLDWRDGCLVVDGKMLPAVEDVHVVAVGKAAIAMAQGAVEVLNGIIVSGDVIAKEGHGRALLPSELRVYEAGHPIPDERGVLATNLMISALNRLDAGVVLALVSGGGSALLEAPREGVTLADIAQTTDLLLRAGAPIEALNAVRAPLSRVKGGGLRAAAPNCTWVTLILSDVLGNDPRIIASGPTVPGVRSPRLALEAIDRYGVRGQIPVSVLSALESDSVELSPQQTTEDVLLVVGDNAAAVRAAADKAATLGLGCRTVWRSAQGEAADLGREFVSVVSQMPDSVDVVLGGGEATVTVRGNGRGGRNTEFSLAAAIELDRHYLADWVVASLGTDGQDAVTGYAGAIADAATVRRAVNAGVDPLDALERNDSLTVFEVAGGAVHTGPTGTNVNDIYIAVRRKTHSGGTSERGH
jgi:glycerate 2-kinase